MALIADEYVWVKSEEMDFPVQTATHPVETGTEITSHVRQQPATLRVSGVIAGEGCQQLVQRFKDLMRGGYALSYVGRNILTHCHVVRFSTEASSEIAGGFAFDMTLKELRVARNNWMSDSEGYSGDILINYLNYDGTATVQALSEVRERYHRMQPGDTLYTVATQFASKGVTTGKLREINRDRGIFQPGYQGNYAYLLPAAEILLGVW